jgi:hypothetical protein
VPNENGYDVIAWRLKPTGNFNRKKDTIFIRDLSEERFQTQGSTVLRISARNFHLQYR